MVLSANRVLDRRLLSRLVTGLAVGATSSKPHQVAAVSTEVAGAAVSLFMAGLASLSCHQLQLSSELHFKDRA